MRTHVTHRLAFTATVALVLLACSAASVQASTVVSENDPFNAVVSGGLCGGAQTITFNGMGHVLITYTSDGNGGYSGTVHGNLQDVKGVDENGNTYVFLTNLESSFTSNGASTFTAEGDEAIISRGGTPNDFGRVFVHMTVNANGVLTSSITVDSVGCRG